MSRELLNRTSTFIQWDTMAKTKTKKKPSKSTKSRSKKKTAARPDAHGQLLRDHLLYLLKGGGAHIGFDDAFGEWPVNLIGVRSARR
jgi:hypothetical protein